MVEIGKSREFGEKEKELTELTELSNDQEDERTLDLQEPYWRSVMAIVTAGCAFMSDGYQQGIMTPLNMTLAKSYSGYDSSWKTMVSNSNLVANILGQIGFGFIVDRIGRKQGFAMTTVFIILGSILAACSKGSSQNKLFWMLLISRGVSGIGIGGEYPCSASSAMEAADERMGKHQKLIPFICATNLPISLGIPVATCVYLIVLEIWGETNTSGIWRTCFAIGAVFPMSIFIFRWRMHHAKVFRKNAIKEKVPHKLVIKRLWKPFMGVSVMWFIMDFVIYPNNIFSSSVISIVLPHAGIKKTAEWQLFLGSFAAFGSIIGMFLFKWMTRKQVIIAGFLAYGVLSIIVGAAFAQLSKIPSLFIIFYALMNLVIYAGPANLQSAVSSESFPTAVRGTLYGLSAAIGKAGAAIGTEVFTPIQTHAGKRYTFFLSGGVCFIGALAVWLWVPDTTDYDLDEEDKKFNHYLLANGWTGEMGERNDKHHMQASNIESD
ncbi:unnamed protein product [Kuraishia capsulata CBS 1993]|uniref:Major facilitator superfamily (MFS) profile domain-containing protein n=1 Tax=Kuraishia capsulata CBS 1993 TaxID=1382522 RepID=W6MQA7_9ASCO|nr:uncharacterized protein KUCA_T00000035001 [Kuraishia capsulata CBS 1993]CDK24075.1 unnamed protein product [Kuraishia capsulata CBS 1993]